MKSRAFVLRQPLAFVGLLLVPVLSTAHAGDTKRIQLTARLRGRATVQVTGERMEWVQAVAKVALSKF